MSRKKLHDHDYPFQAHGWWVSLTDNKPLWACQLPLITWRPPSGQCREIVSGFTNTVWALHFLTQGNNPWAEELLNQNRSLVSMFNHKPPFPLQEACWTWHAELFLGTVGTSVHLFTGWKERSSLRTWTRVAFERVKSSKKLLFFKKVAYVVN